MSHKRILFPRVREVQWETFALPETIGAHDIVAEARFSLVSSGTEVALYSGTHIGFRLENPPFPMMPQRAGYAFVGEVIEVGVDVDQIKLGDHVMMEAPHGTVAVMDARDDRLVKLPDHLDTSDGPLIRMADIALTTLRLAPIQFGDAVVVYGLGLVGQLAAQLYRLHGASPVIGVDLLPSRVEVAQQNDLIALNGREVNIPDEVNRLTDGRGPDVVVEATGNPNVILLALKLVAKGGRITLLGSTRGQVELDVYSHIHRKGVQLLGAHESTITLDMVPRRWNKKRDLALLAKLFADRQLSTRGLISDTISSEELPRIYDLLAQKPEACLGVLIDWQS